MSKVIYQRWLAAALIASTCVANAEDGGVIKFRKADRQSMATAMASSHEAVTLMVATKIGRTQFVIDKTTALGADLRVREDDVGYARFRIVLDHVSKIASLSDVVAVMVDADTSQELSEAEAAKTDVWQGPRWGDSPISAPYDPLPDMGGAGWGTRKPSWDGRGVTLGLLDMHVDFLLPELQRAYRLDGTAVPKVQDVILTTDPRDSDRLLQPQWVRMDQVVSARGGKVSFNGQQYSVSGAGRFRIGLLQEKSFKTFPERYLSGDLDRDGNPAGAEQFFAVLWNEDSGEVWVDTNMNHSFSDESALADYRLRPQIGTLGRDDPNTAIRESVGFAVRIDKQKKYVAICVGAGAHSTSVIGAVLGNRSTAGRVQGIAPGASLISVSPGNYLQNYPAIEGMIAAVKDSRVDVLASEYLAESQRGDGNRLLGIIAGRLASTYRKLLFFPGGNTPGFSTVAEDSFQGDGVQADGVIHVGAYQSRESYRANVGVTPEGADHMHSWGRAHGPGRDGSLKPDLLAPSGQISSMPAFVWRQEWQEKKGFYTLPPGYAMGTGTSTATPVAAGAAALLIGAARQKNIPYDAMRLQAALFGGTRRVEGIPAFAQGNGLIQLDRSLALLEKFERSPPIQIESRASVRTWNRQFPNVPAQGRGLYEQQGWAAGTRGVRTMTFKRTSGPAKPMRFDIAWRGNDGTFTSPSTIELALNREAELPIDIGVQSAGVHAATIELKDPRTDVVAYRTLATIVAPLEFSSGSGYATSTKLQVPYTNDRSVFVRVPEGAGALNVGLDAGGKIAQVAAYSPSGKRWCGGARDAGSTQCIVERPEPGVWELNIDAFAYTAEFNPSTADRSIGAVDVTVSATLVGASVVPVSASRKQDGWVAQDLAIRNDYAPLQDVALSGAMESVQTFKGRLSPGEQHLRTFDVPKGATRLRVGVATESPVPADLDIYLFKCNARDSTPSKSACSARGKSVAVGDDVEIQIENPEPGKWIAVIDGYRISQGGVEYLYRDGYQHSDWQQAVTLSSPASSLADKGWKATLRTQRQLPPGAGRQWRVRVEASADGSKGDKKSSMFLGARDIDLANEGE